MKKIFALILAVFMTLVLISCGNTVPGSGTDTESSATKSEGTQNTASSDTSETGSSDGTKVLVAYFSRTGENYGVGMIEKGNTEIIAEMIALKTGGDLFRIEPVNAYPAGYDECTKVAREEKDSNARPKLAAEVENINDYDVVYIGYPIWWSDMPNVRR